MLDRRRWDDAVMSRQRSRRALQVLLVALGSVALAAGGSTVLMGVESILGAETVSATVDSEMRFYAVWYAGAGLMLLRSARRLEAEAWMIRGIAWALFVAGCSRGLSWLIVGQPHLLTKVLMAIELALPIIIVSWLRSVERGRGDGAE